MLIAFNSPQLDLRGTCVALYDYARYNQLLFGYSSIITLPSSSKGINEPSIVLKFCKLFEILYYDDLFHLERQLLEKRCNLLYCIKYGKNDGFYLTSIPTAIHCVFDMSEPHGYVYAGVSETLAKKFHKTLFVPHMIGLVPVDGDWREALDIPEDAIVFGRHGGQDTFDLDFVKKTIISVVNSRRDIYFIFVNTPVFMVSPQVIHIDSIVDLEEKSRFINTCDAMIHGQSLGETFGISIGEFSIHNKPIITYSGPVWNDAYREILGNGALYYRDSVELREILTSFNPKNYLYKDLNFYKKYNPHSVMSAFHKVFIEPLLLIKQK